MEDNRKISKLQGEKFATENGMKFLETSARENLNVQLAFMTVIFFTRKSKINDYLFQLVDDILKQQKLTDEQKDNDQITIGSSESTNPKACCS